VAFAAGNDSSGFNSYQLLEDKPNALVVGALTRDGSIPTYSNGGASIYAPGGDAYAGSDPAALLAHNVVSTYTGASYVTAAATDCPPDTDRRHRFDRTRPAPGDDGRTTVSTAALRCTSDPARYRGADGRRCRRVSPAFRLARSCAPSQPTTPCARCERAGL